MWAWQAVVPVHPGWSLPWGLKASCSCGRNVHSPGPAASAGHGSPTSLWLPRSSAPLLPWCVTVMSLSCPCSQMHPMAVCRGGLWVDECEPRGPASRMAGTVLIVDLEEPVKSCAAVSVQQSWWSCCESCCSPQQGSVKRRGSGRGHGALRWLWLRGPPTRPACCGLWFNCGQEFRLGGKQNTVLRGQHRASRCPSPPSASSSCSFGDREPPPALPQRCRWTPLPQMLSSPSSIANKSARSPWGSRRLSVGLLSAPLFPC